jgi:hypothetical protein
VKGGGKYLRIRRERSARFFQRVPTRNGAVSSAVLVHRGSHPLCAALTGATRSGVAGVRSLLRSKWKATPLQIEVNRNL